MLPRRNWGIATLLVALLLGVGGGLLWASTVPAQSPQLLSAGLSQNTWTLDAFLLNGVPQDLSTTASYPITLMAVPQQQHMLAGYDGCNDFDVTYSASHGHLHLTHGLTSLVFCFGSRGILGDRYQLAFLRVTTYLFDWTGLRLQDESGAVLLHYRVTQSSNSA